ncbi:hypothetical protein PoB_001648200 [Plakobranchus ocellatus]|uniref:Uncharacterized protein n=1 Tax=Plakobranchus ocellatus TaxID=259542 RepID=A0AAV3Z601_9GAST|nr:hypothetical protein PoB_001648200 [Plakobranchus ocellatus]
MFYADGLCGIGLQGSWIQVFDVTSDLLIWHQPQSRNATQLVWRRYELYYNLGGVNLLNGTDFALLTLYMRVRSPTNVVATIIFYEYSKIPKCESKSLTPPLRSARLCR